MASLLAPTRAASASWLFFTKPKLQRYRGTSSVLSPFIASCPFSTDNTPPASDGDHHHHDKAPVVLHGPPQKFKMENPFQRRGPANVIEVDDLKGGTLVRVAVPGVGPDGFKAWAENNTVFFAGKGEVELKGEESGRTYGVSLDFSPELYRADGFKAEVTNGILRLLVPFVEGGEKKEE